MFGATEVGAPTLLFDTDDSRGADADVKTSADWSWMQFSDRVKTRWVDQGDGTYELQFLVGCFLFLLWLPLILSCVLIDL